ncbi:hypothetical protein ACFONG_03370 [Uliginosibacterium paludis]|uniref:Uncharacterized protein n=1 Tax=Uliginosibacterium paludis TaxID=1615952 RepID=A0ABV2CNW3_9RHOO
MPTPAPVSRPLPPPRKTAAGAEALARRDPRFNAVQRRLLILIDGRRDALILQGLLPDADVPAELERLAGAGLIDSGADAPPSVVPPVPVEEAVASLPGNWPEIRAWMSEQARSSLGVLAVPLLARLEGVADAGAMRSAISQWHLAVRGSRLGQALADDGLARIHEMLGA